MIDQPGGVAHHQARAVDVHRHVGQHELDPLEVGDRPVELAPLLGIGDGGVERGLGDADGLGADGRPRAVERAERHAESLALLAQPVFHRDLAVAQVDGDRR